MRRPFSTSQRWPLVKEQAGTEVETRVRVMAALAGLAVVVGGAIGLIAALRDVSAPSVAGIALRGAPVLLGVLAIAWAIVAPRRPARASGASLEADANGLWRATPEEKERAPVLEWGRPFGVTLLASYGRPHALLAFTSPTRTRYVPVRIEGRSDADDETLARIAVLADLDLVDGVAHDAALSAADAAGIVRYVEGRNGDATRRIYLSDGRGTPISLDRGNLSVQGKSFDLTSQLEWRALMFHESTGQAAALYQATSIRQSGQEVVLVAPMPASIVPREPNAHREAAGRLGRTLTRDLKLLQAPAEAPPAREVRVAIDRPFMMAVRHALDEAPLATRVVPEPPARPRTERSSIA